MQDGRSGESARILYETRDTMKRSVAWILISYSVFGLTSIPVRAQETGSEKDTLVVEPGNDLRAALEKGVRLKAVGQPITAKLIEPVYAGEALAIPAGSTIKGHVSAISKAPMRRRTQLAVPSRIHRSRHRL